MTNSPSLLSLMCANMSLLFLLSSYKKNLNYLNSISFCPDKKLYLNSICLSFFHSLFLSVRIEQPLHKRAQPSIHENSHFSPKIFFSLSSFYINPQSPSSERIATKTLYKMRHYAKMDSERVNQYANILFITFI